MAPGHAHPHHGLHVDAAADGRRLALALGLIVGLMIGEVVAGVLASSLALLSDAAHMLTDAGALALSLVAARLARRPAGGAMTFGLGRTEILSAQINGATLLVLAVLIVLEGVRRLIDPPAPQGAVVLGVALAGIAVNALAARVLAGSSRRSLNLEGSLRHVLTDLYAFLATALAGAVVLLVGFDRADPLASLVVAALMLRSAWALLRASGRVFLEAAPEGIDPADLGAVLVRQPGVVEVHDLHVWEVTSGFPALSAHVLVPPDSDCHATRRQLEAVLAERFGIHHSTLQVEHEEPERLLRIEHPGERRDKRRQRTAGSGLEA